MKMPDKIEDIMFAPCGINCAVCYMHVKIRKNTDSCEGCVVGDTGKPEYCRKCNIKSCTREKGHSHCFECETFPCKLIKNLEKNYNERYDTSILKNSKTAKEKGISLFLEQDRQKWACQKCGGTISLHDRVCSECESTTV